VCLFFIIFFLWRCQSSPTNTVVNNAIYNTAIDFSVTKTWIYDAAYYRIPYPNGDVPGGGACTDVIIRVLRANGIDLQKEVHEDMNNHFDAYPKKWGLIKTDPNIDHRRVPNLMTYFERQGWTADTTWQPGDIVCWELSPGITHIGILLTGESVYHNIGPVAKIDDNFLFRYNIIGHYRIH
jgi:uncharacterized protein YijF (DUF1287 family)